MAESDIERFLRLLTQGCGIERAVDGRLGHAARFRAQQALDQVGYDYVEGAPPGPGGGIPHPPQAERLKRLGWTIHNPTAELAIWGYQHLDPIKWSADGLLASKPHRDVLDNKIWTHWGAGRHTAYKPGDAIEPLNARDYLIVWLSVGVPPMKVIVYNNAATVDALNASFLASKYASPLFPIEKSAIPPQVRQEIDLRDPQEIIIVGGTGVIDATAEAELAKLAPVRRVAGATRYDTAVAVSRA
jgi:hypothetical protein